MRQSKSIPIDIFLFQDASVSTALMMHEFFNLANLLFGNPESAQYQPAYLPFDCSLVGMQGGVHAPGHKRGAQQAIQINLGPPRRQAKLLFIPPIWHDSGRLLSARLDAETDLMNWVRQAHQRGAIISSCCTGTSLLARAGLLEEAQATGCWWLAPWYAKHTPKARFCLEKLTHADNRIWTAAAGSAFFTLFLYILEHYAGNEVAERMGRMMLVSPNDAPQAAFMSRPNVSNIEDIVVAKAQRWIAKHLANDFELQTLAGVCAVSTRTLLRRFQQAVGQTPLRYLQQERIAKAKVLLASTAASLEHVMSQVGYSDLSSFRKLFREHTGLTPVAYRARFRLNRYQQN
jgi:transcriptional regulator GlxA family with amidase domain